MSKPKYIRDSNGLVVAALIPPLGPPAPAIQLGQIDGSNAVVQSVQVNRAAGEFTTVTIELMLMSYGMAAIPPLDFAKIFGQPEVAKSVNDEIQNQTRKFNFDG